MIYYFNPGHETAISNASKYYMAPANVVNMQSDLAYLPAYCCTNDNFILLNEQLPIDFNQEMGIAPNTFTIDDIPKIKDRLANQKVNLWGISPQSIHYFDTLSKEHQLNLVLPDWTDEYKYFSSRQFAADCLSFLAEHQVISQELIPRFFTSLNDIENYLSQNNTQRFLAKAPYSSSGRGLLWLPVGELTRTENQILHGHLKKQGMVSIEKVLDKRVDFAMEFSSKSRQISYLGLSLFKTNEKGAYISNSLNTQDNIKNTLTEYISPEVLETVQKLLMSYFTDKIAPTYEGYIGVDMMIYETNGIYSLQPCVEINLRNNMGILSMNIMDKVVAKGSKGTFYLDFNSKACGILESDQQMRNQYPTLFNDGKLASGYLSLCPVSESTKYRAYILIEKQ